MMNRRLFLFAAPAIIAAPSLMRVSAKALDVPGPVLVNLKPRLWVSAGNLQYAFSDDGTLWRWDPTPLTADNIALVGTLL